MRSENMQTPPEIPLPAVVVFFIISVDDARICKLKFVL